ncbi:3-deoxy-8-phosphooctulonate synthase [uncultured Roseivirga sp.]|uniref:3-deoxy-8-phosphooctulonate synthase n=1 Tax=uncultured Roseivirga sp. TaxID=543088 RepID=UPI0030D70322|tara:strand:- start:2135 stop:2980 length:846 start_codon:yes stop_codon:yes gene_type:complete
MNKFEEGFRISDSVEVGNGKMVLFSGPCAVESYDICAQIAETLIAICSELDIQYVFKASFDKANRTSVDSFRSVGFEAALDVLAKIKANYHVPIVTDIHEPYQASPVSEVADALQIPAYLCRQTDLLVAAGNTGKTVKIKRGQFMAAEDMEYAVNKVKSTGNEKVCLTERGVSFGYHNLVVDMRSLPVMRQFAPVIFDVTHSVQQPGGLNGKSGGQREFAPYLARAAAATGVDGFFIETHPDPSKALSDGPNLIPLDKMKGFMKMLKTGFEYGNNLDNTIL